MNPAGRIPSALCLALFLAGPVLPAQARRAPGLLKDIDARKGPPYSSNPTGRPAASNADPASFLVVGNVFYFIADDGIHGKEIWCSTAIPQTARRVTDAAPGWKSLQTSELTWFKGFIYFQGYDPDHGREAWRTNGTPAGTYLFRDTMPGPESGGFHRPLAAGGALWYFARTGLFSYSLFRYGGSPGSPVQVKSGFSEIWQSPAYAGGKVVFFCKDSSGALALWTTDGTAAGTRVLLRGYRDSHFVAPVASGGRIYFSFCDSTGWAIWETDGKRAVKLQTLSPRFPWRCPVALGKKILFQAPPSAAGGENPWVLDTSTGKARLLKKVAQGGRSGFQAPVRLGGIVLFCVQGPPSQPWTLWRTDGTPGGTTQVTTKGFQSYQTWTAPVASGGKVFFQGKDPLGGAELWATDGTDPGTYRVRDIFTGFDSSYPAHLTPLPGGKVAFSARARQTGRELWISDGTKTGTFLLQDIRPGSEGYGSNPSDPADFFGRCFFFARDPFHGGELWVTGGTPAGTGLFKEFIPGANGGAPGGMFPLREKLIFYVSYGNPGAWASDGTPGGTALFSSALFGWKPGPLVMGKKAFLWGVDGTHGWEPWVTDGTAGGTRLLWDTYPGRRSPDDPEWVKAGKKVFFIAGVKSDRSFWVSDLTPSGTKPLAQKLAVCRNLVALGSRALFEGKKGSAAGLEPWISDGTPGGTGMLIDLAPGFQDGGFQAPFVLGDKVYFFGTDGKTVSFGKKGLFETDGTPGGTKRVGTWETDRAPSRACVVGGRAVFWARDPAHGMEPWVTDGTAPGTVLLADLAPGPDSTSDVSFLPMGRRKGVFVFQGPSREKNLLVTDGTPAGSFVLPSPRPGVPLKASGVLAFSGGKLFFGADDGFTGTEPWAWFPGATAQAVGWSQGGARLDGEDPVLGGKFRLTVTGIPKGGAGILLLGKPLSRPLLLGGGAALFLDAAARPLVGFSLGASGSPAFALPGDPALIGARLAAQAVVGPTRTPPFNLDFTNGLFLTLGD